SDGKRIGDPIELQHGRWWAIDHEDCILGVVESNEGGGYRHRLVRTDLESGEPRPLWGGRDTRAHVLVRWAMRALEINEYRGFARLREAPLRFGDRIWCAAGSEGRIVLGHERQLAHY